MHIQPSKKARKHQLFFPCLTVFVSSACIMILELVAGRLVARHLGSSLYTWTSVIGVVLAGITIGNYIGGRLADHKHVKRIISIIFVFSSMSCVGIIVMNNLIGNWVWLWHFNWPLRVFCHVTLLFLLPSLLLGLISPLIAKLALDQGQATGKTIGTVYASGAAGSILGTFLAGYYLIAAMGTVKIIWMVGGILLLIGFLYGVKLKSVYLWSVIFVTFLFFGFAPNSAIKLVGESLSLRGIVSPTVLYEDETPYCYVRVVQKSRDPDIRSFEQDRLVHSMGYYTDLTNIKYSYPYVQYYAAVTSRLAQQHPPESALVIGGGGYVFPRYLRHKWPHAAVDVVEIDGGVTEAAIKGFGLPPDTSIRTFTMDARNYVDQLLIEQERSGSLRQYDFIYEDAINSYSVPFQLVTKEFNDKVFKLLSENGAYFITLIDVFDLGGFAGSVYATLRETFPYVYVVTEKDLYLTARRTFVLVATKRQIPFAEILSGDSLTQDSSWVLTDSDLQALREKSGELVLTDDFAPVENLLAPVVRSDSRKELAAYYVEKAAWFKQERNWNKSLSLYERAMQINPTMTDTVCNEIAMLLIEQGNFSQARDFLDHAVRFNRRHNNMKDIPDIHLNLGLVSKMLGQPEEGKKHLRLAQEGFAKICEKQDKPPSDVLIRYGNTLAELKDFSGAAAVFQRTVELYPFEWEGYYYLASLLDYQGNKQKAMEALQKGIEMLSTDRKDTSRLRTLQNQLK